MQLWKFPPNEKYSMYFVAKYIDKTLRIFFSTAGRK